MSRTGAARGGRQCQAGDHGEVLSEYRRRKLELAEVVRAAMLLAERRHDQERVTTGRDLLARLLGTASSLRWSGSSVAARAR
jgi:hypothetical protein